MIRPFCIVLIALGGMFGFGCQTPQPGPDSRPSSRKKSRPPAVVVSPPASQPAAGGLSVEERAAALAHYATGVSYDLNDKPELALEQYYKSALMLPDNNIVVAETAARLLQDKQHERAIEVLARAATRTNASGTIHAMLARAYLRDGQTNAAIAASEKALKQRPDSLLAYQNLAEIYFETGKPAEAIALLEQAAQEPKLESDFLINLAESYAKYLQLKPEEGDAIKAKAVGALDRAFANKPTRPTPLLRLADAYAQFGEFNRAAEIYTELQEDYADIPAYRDMVREKLARVYLRSNQKDKAVEQLEALSRDNPTNPQTSFELGSLHAERKDYEAAAAAFHKTIIVAPDFEPAYHELARAQMGADDPEAALETLEKAREKFRQSFLTEFYAGLACEMLKRHTDALKHYNTAEIIAGAAGLKKMDFVFYFQVGSCYERNRDYEQAAKYLQKALEIRPDDAATLNHLGYMWADQGIHLEKAKGMIEKALEKEPDNAAYLDSLGWVLFKLKQPAQALTYLLKAAELTVRPDPTVYDHIGDVYSALNQPEKARAAWQKSLEIEANDAVKKKLSLTL